MPTKKHHAFVSSRKGSQRSQDVPGIGSVYAGRLAKHNITSASQLTDLYHQTSSKAEFLREYQSMTGANSRYSGMTYEGIRQQAAMSDYGRQSYSNSTRDYSCSAPFSFPTTLQPTYSTSNQTIRNPVSSPLLTTATQDQSGQAAKTTIFTTNIKADSSKTSATEVKLNPIKKPVVYGLDPIDFLLAHTSTPETSQNIFGQNEKSGISNVIIKKDSPTTSAIQPIPTQVKLDQTTKINAFGSTTTSVDSTLVQASTTSTSSQDTYDQKGNISLFTNAISSDFPKTSVNKEVDQIKKEMGMETQNASPTTFKQTSYNKDENPTISNDDSQNTSTKQPAAKQDMLDQIKKEVGRGTQNASPTTFKQTSFNQDEKPTITSGDSQKTSTKQPAAKQDVLDQIKKEVGRGTQNATPIPSPKDTYNKDEKPTISNGDSQNTSTKQPAAKQDMLDQIKKEVGRGTQNATPIPSPKDTYNKDEKPTITSGDSQNTSTKQPAAKQDMLDQIKKEVGRGTQNATPIPSPKDTCNQDEKPTITSGDSQNTSTKQPAAKQDVLDQIKKEAESGTQNASPTTFKQTTEISASLPIQIKICNIHETNASRDVTKASRPYICGRCLNDQKRGELLDLRIATAKADQIANKKLNKLKIRALELEIENKELDLQMKKTSLSTPANQNVDQIKKKVGSGTQNATPIPSPKDTFNQDEKPTITSDDSQNTSTNQAAAKQDMLDQSNKEVGSGTQNATPIPSPKDTFNQDEKPTITSDGSQNTSTKQPAAKEYVADQIKKEVKRGTQNRPQPLFKNTYNQDVTPTISSVDYNADSPKISAPETHAFEDVIKASRPYICGRCLNDQKRGELLDLRIATAKADQIANEKLNKLKIPALELEIENKELDLQIKKKSLST